MRILKEKTCAVVIDMQKRLLPVIHEHDKLEKNINILIRGLKALEVPILATQQYTKGLGTTSDMIKEALGESETIEKASFSCLDELTFKNKLESLNKKCVIIAGVESHICVQQTVLDLLDNGYLPVVVQDCVGSRSKNDKEIAIERMKKAGAIITTYESILFELCRISGTVPFKTISNLVK